MTSTATGRLNSANSSRAVKAPVRSVCTTNITASGLSAITTIDGSLTPVADDRFLLAGQTSSVDNGIYVASSGTWTRATDFDTNRDVAKGTLIVTESGLTYRLTSSNPIVIGTTALTFSSNDSSDIVTSLASTAVGAGAALVGINDAASVFSGATVEAALQEAGQLNVINALTAETSPAVADLFGIYDASAGAGRKMTMENALKVINALTADAAPDVAADYVVTYDASASGVKKVLLRDITGAVTRQATTSGTSIDFTGIPASAKRITISFESVSTNNTDVPVIQIGDAGGVETSGYRAQITELQAAANSASLSTSAFPLCVGAGWAAGDLIIGQLVLTLSNSSANTWVVSGNIYNDNSGFGAIIAGSKSLSAVLDRIRLTTDGGTGTFDAGAVSILVG